MAIYARNFVEITMIIPIWHFGMYSEKFRTPIGTDYYNCERDV